MGEDIKTLLTEITTDIKIDDMPDEIDNVLCIYHTGGSNPEYEFGKQNPAFENPTFQVRIRHKDTSTALQWSDSVKNILSGLTEQNINGNRYLAIFQQSDILGLGRDEKKRSKYSINFKVQKG